MVLMSPKLPQELDQGLCFTLKCGAHSGQAAPRLDDRRIDGDRPGPARGKVVRGDTNGVRLGGGARHGPGTDGHQIAAVGIADDIPAFKDPTCIRMFTAVDRGGRSKAHTARPESADGAAKVKGLCAGFQSPVPLLAQLDQT